MLLKNMLSPCNRDISYCTCTQTLSDTDLIAIRTSAGVNNSVFFEDKDITRGTLSIPTHKTFKSDIFMKLYLMNVDFVVSLPTR